MAKISSEEKAFKRALTAYNSGDNKAAVRLLKKIIKFQSDNSEANHIMGLALVKDNNVEASLKFFRVALETNSGVAQYWYSYINALILMGDIKEALHILQISKHKGCRGKAFDDLATKLASPEIKLKLKVQSFKQLIQNGSNSELAYLGLAAALKLQGKIDEALNTYRAALNLMPDCIDAYLNLSLILMDQGKLEEAVESYKKVISIKPSCAEAYNNMGVALYRQDKLTLAMNAFNSALTIKLDYTDAWLNGAEALEKWNKIEQLGLWLEKAFQNFEDVPADILLMKATFFLRKRAMPEATDVILSIDPNSISISRKCDFFNVKAKCYEFNHKFDYAYECFLNMNSLIKNTDDYLRCDPEKYIERIKSKLSLLHSTPIQKPEMELTDGDGFKPVFFVGFPRSGTTLLDTILRSHTFIDVVEEQPALHSAKIILKNTKFSDVLSGSLSPEIILEAKKAFQTEFEKHVVSKNSSSAFIDKLPLNMLDVPIIQTLFPRSQFILAIRHPMDIILSCWTQNFGMNPAMANMVDLDRVVDFYCTAMEFFQTCRTKFDLNVYTIRYEDLIEDVRGETSALLKFLELQWEPQMKNFDRTAAERGRIHTPSYSQVIQPIYRSSKYRWLHYRNYLDKYLSETGPWISKFNYDVF